MLQQLDRRGRSGGIGGRQTGEVGRVGVGVQKGPDVGSPRTRNRQVIGSQLADAVVRPVVRLHRSEGVEAIVAEMGSEIRDQRHIHVDTTGGRELRGDEQSQRVDDH